MTVTFSELLGFLGAVATNLLWRLPIVAVLYIRAFLLRYSLPIVTQVPHNADVYITILSWVIFVRLLK